MKISELPVMDRRSLSVSVVEAQGDWSPPRVTTRVTGARVGLLDGPDIEWRLAAQAARLTSNKFSGQAANDNSDWPLAKLLKTEGLDYHARLAERYRTMHETATAPTELRGAEPNDLYVLEDIDKDGKSHGAKKITGKKANLAIEPNRKILPADGMKRMSAPVPKKWQGDMPLLSKIDAGRELAVLRGQLGFVPKILEAFEMAVVDNMTLAEIGKALGAGSKGGKGEARARIFDGFDIVDRFLQHGGRRKVTTPTAIWEPGMPVPAGYFRSRLQPDMIFKSAA